MTDLYDLHFELSNEDRVKILILLRKTPLNLTNISNTLDLRNQETSRHLSRLEETGLIAKNTDGTYLVTHFAELILRKQQEIDFLVEYRDYFNAHTLAEIPDELVSKIGMLRKSDFINDVMISFQNVQRVVDEAEEYIWRLTDQFMMIFLEHFVAATDRGVEYRLIYNKDIQLPPGSDSTVRMRPARDKGLFLSHTHMGVKAFMVMSEKEVAIISFPNSEGRFDYTGFTSKNEDMHKWCSDLFMSHWENKLPPLLLWKDIPYQK